MCTAISECLLTHCIRFYRHKKTIFSLKFFVKVMGSLHKVSLNDISIKVKMPNMKSPTVMVLYMYYVASKVSI